MRYLLIVEGFLLDTSVTTRGLTICRGVKKYVKTALVVGDKSQIVALYSVYFRGTHDSKELKKILKCMDREIISKIDIIISYKGFDSEEDHTAERKHSFLVIMPARNRIYRIYLG